MKYQPRQKPRVWADKVYPTPGGREVRSRFEARVVGDLERRGVAFEYEPRRLIWYDEGKRGSVCKDCGSEKIAWKRWYLPDLWLPEHGLWIEIKGKFTADDRKTIVGARREHMIDLRMLFMRDNTLSRSSKTRYTEWCRKLGIVAAVGDSVPEEWLNEPRIA